VQFNISTTVYGQTFYSFGPQIGRAPTGVSFAATGNVPSSGYSTGSTGLSQALSGWSWNAGVGVLIGGQWSFNSLFHPFQVSTYGGGVMTPQVGLSLTYGWQGGP